MTSNNITTMTDALKPPPQQSQQSLLPPVRGGVDGLRDYRNDFVVGGGGGGGGGGCAVVRIEMMHYHIGIALVVLQVTDKYANTYVDTYIVLPPTHILLYSQHISPSHPPSLPYCCQDGRNALYDVAVGRLLGRVLAQRGLVASDSR